MTIIWLLSWNLSWHCCELQNKVTPLKRALVAPMICFALSFSAAAVEAGAPRVQWSVNVDQRLPNSPVSLSMPAVMQHGSETWLVLGGRDGWAHVYDIEGAEVKRFFLGGKSDSGALALSNGLVVLGDTAGLLYAVDPAKAEVVWQYQLTSTFTSTPVAVDGGFLVQTADNRVYCFSQEGEKRWSYSGSGSVLSMYTTPSPIVVAGNVYAFLSNGDAIALLLDNGDLLWKRQLLLSNDTTVLSELQAPLATPVLVDELHMDGERLKKVLFMPFYQGEMIAISVEDGTQFFSLPISLKSAPLILDAVLYAADSEGFLHAYDIKQGVRLWRKKITDAELAGPILWQGSIWLTDHRGEVYHLDLSGEIQGSTTVPGRISRLPVVTDAGLLVRTDRGAMYMVNK